MFLTNPEDKKKFKSALDEISASFTRIEAERDHIKEIKKEVVDKFPIPKKLLNRLARVYHNQNFADEKQEFDDLESLYDTCILDIKNSLNT